MLYPLNPTFKASIIFPIPIWEIGDVLALSKKVFIKNSYDLVLLLNGRCAFSFPLIFGKDLLGTGDNEEERL